MLDKHVCYAIKKHCRLQRVQTAVYTKFRLVYTVQSSENQRSAYKKCRVHTKLRKKIFQTMRKGTVVLKSLHSRGGGEVYPLITATGSKRVLTFTRSASL